MCDVYCGLKKDRRGGKTELPGLSALFDLKPLHQLFQMGRCCSCSFNGGWWDWSKGGFQKLFYGIRPLRGILGFRIRALSPKRSLL